MTRRRKIVLLFLVLTQIVLTFAQTAMMGAHASVLPAKPISGDWNTQMCGSNSYERITMPQTQLAVNDSAGTCVEAQEHHGDFYVSQVTKTIGWQYPSITSGYVPEGTKTCVQADCYTYPVRQEDDGTPVASFGAWLAPGHYNLAFDIWLSPYAGEHAYRQNRHDTEVMVWLEEPGIHDSFDWYVTIDRVRFGVMTWITRGGWRYVAYVALGRSGENYGRHIEVKDLWLNPFMRDAIKHHYLVKEMWLQEISAGFELEDGGVSNGISHYNLADVN